MENIKTTTPDLNKESKNSEQRISENHVTDSRANVLDILELSREEQNPESNTEKLVENLCNDFLEKGRKMRKISRVIQGYEEDLASLETSNRDFKSQIETKILELKKQEEKLKEERKMIIDQINSLDSIEPSKDDLEKINERLQEIEEEIDDILEVLKSTKKEKLHLMIGMYSQLITLSKEKIELIKKKQAFPFSKNNNQEQIIDHNNTNNVIDQNTLSNNNLNLLAKKIDDIKLALDRNQSINNEEFTSIKRSLEELRKNNENNLSKISTEKLEELENKIKELEEKFSNLQKSSVGNGDLETEHPENTDHKASEGHDESHEQTEHKKVKKAPNKIAKAIRKWVNETFQGSLLVRYLNYRDHKRHEKEHHKEPQEENNQEKPVVELSPDQKITKFLQIVEKMKKSGIGEQSPLFYTGLRAAGYGEFVKDNENSSSKEKAEKGEVLKAA